MGMVISSFPAGLILGELPVSWGTCLGVSDPLSPGLSTWRAAAELATAASVPKRASFMASPRAIRSLVQRVIEEPSCFEVALVRPPGAKLKCSHQLCFSSLPSWLAWLHGSGLGEASLARNV